MAKITSENIAECYELGAQFSRGMIPFDRAVDEATKSGMNRASASDYIRNVKYMVEGYPYKRTISAEGTRYYLERISNDFGEQGLRTALSALKGHISYYEGLQSITLHAQRSILEEFSTNHKDDDTQDVSAGDYSSLFQVEIEKSIALNPDDRKRRLVGANHTPERNNVLQAVFRRNPDVIAERLFIAHGTCEGCGRPAPFLTRRGAPFLEVHHRLPLSEGGEDTVENTMALCPNCHREAHYGQNWKAYRN